MHNYLFRYMSFHIPICTPTVQIPTNPSPVPLQLQEAITALEKHLKSRKNGLQGQNLIRYRAVLVFLNFQLTKPAVVPLNLTSSIPTRLDYVILTAKSFRKNVYFTRKVVTWERQWRQDQKIDEGHRGCYVKTRSWFNNEGVQLVAREFMSENGKSATASKLAQAIAGYLDSSRAGNVLSQAFSDSALGKDAKELVNHHSRRITARTARKWLKKLGFKHCRFTKGVFFDGHEREDVVDYRNTDFIPKWLEFRDRMVRFNKDGLWSLPPGCVKGSDGNYYVNGKRPVVLVTYDESIFYENDGK